MIELANILKKDKIIRISPADTLANSLTKLSSSHDAGFVFDHDKFLGLINPYYCLIKSSHPGNSKVANCLHHPPKIYIDFPIDKVAQLLVESKIHYLPVFDRGENFMGIITARRLLSRLKDLPVFKTKVDDLLGFFGRMPLVVIYEDATVSQAINLFKKSKKSKLVVINRDMKLRGVLSYYDLISFMMTTKNKGGRQDIKSDKSHLYSQHIKKFIKTFVLTLKKGSFISDAFRLIIDKKIGSVILVDDDRHPIGIITTKDLLRYFIGTERLSFIKNVSSRIGRIFSKKKTYKDKR